MDKFAIMSDSSTAAAVCTDPVILALHTFDEVASDDGPSSLAECAAATLKERERQGTLWWGGINL